MKDIIIRNATLEDLNKVTEIESICFPPSESAKKNIFEDRIKNYSDGFYICELESKIIGFINGAITNEEHIEDEFFENMDLHIPQGNNIAIFGLDILPDYQNNGYAAKLMTHFIEASKNKGLKKVMLTCKDHLIHYYMKFGFKLEGVSNSVHGGAKWHDMYINL